MLLGRTARSPAAGSGPHTAFVDEENDVSGAVAEGPGEPPCTRTGASSRRRSSRQTPMRSRPCTTRRLTIGLRSGRSRRGRCSGTPRGPRCSRGIRPSRSGSRAAPSMSRSTAWTGTSSPVTATRSRTTGKANRGHAHHHVRRPQGRGLQGHERAARAGCRRATGSPSTCR